LIILITIILLVILFSNLALYWIIFLKTEMKRSEAWDNYTKVFLAIFALSLVSIPIITSRFLSLILGSKYYFHDQWPVFILLGIVLLILGIKVGKLAMDQNKVRGLAKGKHRLITGGIYGIMRHPMYTAWSLAFIGLTFICDSLISIILIPFIILLLGFEGYLEERLLLFPKFGDKYVEYEQQTPNRLFPSPYNTVLTIIGIFVVYIGVINFNIIFGL